MRRLILTKLFKMKLRLTRGVRLTIKIDSTALLQVTAWEVLLSLDINWIGKLINRWVIKPTVSMLALLVNKTVNGHGSPTLDLQMPRRFVILLRMCSDGSQRPSVCIDLA